MNTSPGRKLRILFSARDTGAALNIREIAAEAVNRQRLDVEVVAAEPGWSSLHARLGFVRRFANGSVHNAADADVEPLMREARALVEEIQPDAVCVGQSGPDAGLDEALLAVCQDRTPTYAFQDFWGDLNFCFGKLADCYFVVDEYAARLTRDRSGKRVVVAGAPKYAAYAGLPVDELRKNGRAAMHRDDTQPLAGFFGQPFGVRPGYLETVEVFAAALAAVMPGAAGLYVPHPKESNEDRSRVHSALGAAGHVWQTPVYDRVETALAACDLVATPFSSCGQDQIMLNHFSPRPLGSVVFLMYDGNLTDFYRRYGGLNHIPPAEQGYALEVNDKDLLSAALERALSPAHREHVWQAARTRIDSPEDAARRIVDCLEADFMNNAGRLGTRLSPQETFRKTTRS